MIIDIHTHTFPEKIAARTIEKLARAAHLQHFSDGSASALSASAKRAGIDLCVVLPVATSVQQVEHINDYAAHNNEKTAQTGLFSFGCMHPDYADYKKELLRIRDLGLKGIKLHPVYQNTALDDIKYLRICDEAAQLGLIVLSHTGFDVGFPGVFLCTPGMCRHVMQTVGPFTFIAAHMGGLGYWEEVAELLSDTGIYLDTAFSLGRMATVGDGYWSDAQQQLLTEEGFISLVRAFGAQRILFGTDSPWTEQAAQLTAMHSLSLTDEEKAQILGGNAARLLAL